MKIIGITGGVGSGKSKVLEYIKSKYNADSCQLDEVARELQRKGSDCYEQIVKAFGMEVLLENGELNRQKLAEIIFENPEKRELLNSIVHPKVKQWVIDDMEKCRAKGSDLYVIEAALLIEADYGEICHEMWYIYADDAVRTERLRESRGYSKEKIESILASQLSHEEFRKAVDFVIDNSGSFQETTIQIDKIKS